MPDGAPAFIPRTLSNETVTATPLRKRGDGWACEASRIDRVSPDRVTPPCPHFGACGGCSLQHCADAPLAAWRSEQVAHALHRAGFAWEPRPPISVPPATRRRMDLAVTRQGGRVVLGLHEAGGARVLAIPECRVLHPTLRALLPSLADTLARLDGLRRQGSALLNLLDSGPDLLLRHDSPLSPADRQCLAAWASAHRVPRVVSRHGAAEPELACQLGPATIAFAGVSVTPPPGAFLQASAAGEAAIVAAVLAGLPERLPPRARILELFAGCGTMTFPLATRAPVTAIEGDAASVAALSAAARGRITAVRRDLARQPLRSDEVALFAAVVLDPPFAGAGPQMAALAGAGVPTIVYVSCNPAALARDAAGLRPEGYELVSATVIDQFTWSAHVEAVVVFRLL